MTPWSLLYSVLRCIIFGISDRLTTAPRSPIRQPMWKIFPFEDVLLNLDTYLEPLRPNGHEDAAATIGNGKGRGPRYPRSGSTSEIYATSGGKAPHDQTIAPVP